VHNGLWACPFCQALRFFDLNQGVICGQARHAYDDGRLVEAKAFCEMALACGPCPQVSHDVCPAFNSKHEEMSHGGAGSPSDPGVGALLGHDTAKPGHHARQAPDAADGEPHNNSHPTHQQNAPSPRMAPGSAYLEGSAPLAGGAETGGNL
jgi:hypothetical protein